MQPILDFLVSLFDKIWPFAAVDPWELAVRVRWGKHYVERGPGVYWRWPFGIDRFFCVVVPVQTIDLPEITVETSDRVAMLLSLATRYKVTDVTQARVLTQDYETSLLTDVTMVVTEWINETPYADVTVDNLIKACQPNIKRLAKRWGCEVEALGVNTIAKHRVYRLVTTQVP